MEKEPIRELEEDIVDFFKERLENFTIPIDFKFEYQANDKLKQLIKLTKIPDQYAILIGKAILVQVNTEYFDAFSTKDDLINTILFDQAIDLITYNGESGKFKIATKTNFNANVGIIDKYSYDAVQRSIEAEKLFESQKNDMESDLK
jgi:hypothetical protein